MRAVTLVTLVMLLLLSTPLAAAEAADDETSGSAELLLQGVDGRNESSKFQEYRDVPSGVVLQRLTFGLDKETWTLSVDARALGREDQRVVLEGSRKGSLRVQVGYDQTPHWISSTARTLYLSSGGRFLLPVPMREELQAIPAAAVGPRLAQYLDAAQPVDLRFRRDTAFGRVDWTPTGHLATHVSFSQEQRNGTRPVSLSTYFGVGGDVAEVAAPVDFTTRNASVGAELGGERWNVGASVLYSGFTNHLEADALVIDNPLRAVDATPGLVDPLAPNNPAGARFLLSQPPDNRALWLEVEGTARLTDWARLTAQVGRGRNQQDERFLPFTLNSAAPTQTNDPVPQPVQVLRGDLLTGTPAADYEGEVDLTTYHVRLEADPLDRLGLRVFARSYDYDNETPVYTVTDYVRADTDLEGIARAALPFAWKKDNQGLEADYRLATRLHARVGYEREVWHREFRNTDRSEEDILSAGLHWSPWSWAQLRVGYRHGDRTFDHYAEEHFFGEEAFPEGEPVQNAVVEEQRLFDLAERKRDRVDLMARFQPGEKLSLGANLVWSEDRYDETGLGRTADDSRGFALDAAYAFGERATLSADYGRDTFAFDLDSRYRPVVANVAVDDPLNDWFSHVDDTTDAYGLGLDLDLVPDRWTLGLEARRVDSKTRYENRFVPGGSATGNAPPWPDLENRLTGGTAELRYRTGPRLELSLGVLREVYRQDDWARDVMKPWMGDVDAGAAESAFLGWRVPDYSVNLLRFLVDYRF